MTTESGNSPPPITSHTPCFTSASVANLDTVINNLKGKKKEEENRRKQKRKDDEQGGRREKEERNTILT